MNKKSGIERMASYMTFYAQRILAFFLIFMAVWTLYMTIISGEGFSENLRMLPLYYLFMCGIVGMVFTMGYIPILSNGMLSMGSTRKELCIGLIYGHFMMSVELTVIGMILKAVSDGGVNKDTLLFGTLAFGLNMITTGFGMIVAILIERYGKTAYYIAVAICALSGGGVGGAGSIILSTHDAAIPSFMNNINLIVMVVGIISFIIGSTALTLGMRHKAVTV